MASMHTIKIQRGEKLGEGISTPHDDLVPLV